jgi:DNA mismatch repair protein MutS2
VVSVERREAMVDIGGKRIRAKLGKIFPAAGEEPRTTAMTHGVEYEPVAETSVSVRGMDRESALEEVSRFIDRAVLTGLQEIMIIHGLGEGILARAIREALSRDPRVRAQRPGGPMEGGTGVTFATLR